MIQREDPPTSYRDEHFDREIADIAAAMFRDVDERAPSPSRSFSIVTEDGTALAADLFLPEGPARARLLFASAMGVPKRFYARFLDDLAAHGVASLVVDYRGIAASRGGPIQNVRARLSDWGERDLAAATRTLATLDLPTTSPRVPMLFMGHSVGGQLFGLMRDLPFEAAYFVGSQAGYWRHWDGLPRLGMLALWFGAIPLFTNTLGYLPMKAFGQGENIPRGVAREWAKWGRDPAYIGSHAARIAGAGYATWSGRLRAVAIADDTYAPERAVRELVRLYTASEGDVAVVRPRDVGVSRVGHFGWFRPKFRDTLWADARRFLLDRD